MAGLIPLAIRGRKGMAEDAGESTMSVQYFIVVAVVLGICMALVFVYAFQSKSIENSVPKSLKTKLILERFLYASHCLCHEEGARTYVGVMEWSRFTDSTSLESCYYTGGLPAPEVRLLLQKQDGTKKVVKTLGWDDAASPDSETSQAVGIWDQKLERGVLFIGIQGY